MISSAEYPIYVITNESLSKGRSTVEIVRSAINGGARIIQFREDEWSMSHFLNIGKHLKKICYDNDVQFIINNRVDAAYALKADGIHLGQDDIPPTIARKMLGEDKVIGLSVDTTEQAIDADQMGIVNYFSIGSIFDTITKSDAGKPKGPEIIKKIKENTSLPLVAIGGINLENIGDVAEAGADYAAVISAIVSADDVTQATQELGEKFNRLKKVTVLKKTINSDDKNKG